MSHLPYPKEHYQKKVLDHMNFQYQEKLEDWVNNTLEPEQVLNVSVATHGLTIFGLCGTGDIQII